MTRPNEADNRALVAGFLTTCGEGMAGFADAVKSCFTESAIWENVGGTTTIGVGQALDFLDTWRRSSAVGRYSSELLDVACVDDCVLTERRDRLFDADGIERVALRTMGIFEVRDGKISAWRNYPAQPSGQSVFASEKNEPQLGASSPTRTSGGRIAVSPQVETVRAFFAECEKGTAEMNAAHRRYFTPSTVWENIGMPTTTGADAALRLMAKLQAVVGFERFGAEFIAVAQSNDRVMTERVDYLYDNRGEIVKELRIMGVFDIEDNRIVKWTDYFPV